MPRRKSNSNIKIAIAAIVVAVGIGIGAVSLSDPESKTIASISLGHDPEFPKEVLQTEDGTYYVDMIVVNRTNQEAKTIVTVNGENAKIRLGTLQGWDYKKTLPFTSTPDGFQKKYPLFVMPEDNTSFTIMLSLETPEGMSSPQVSLRHPSILTYEYDGENFVLSEQG